MRPLFAIAPLALALMLLGPSSQASPNEPSWTQAIAAWVFDRDDENSASPELRHSSAADGRSFRSFVGQR
ncbi:MAG: hypothetical protein EOP40_09920 [Rubrivivax sp.]|nr:MAG: hypothetical protein EOP40_09920 [Rubrivivax sp.]